GPRVQPRRTPRGRRRDVERQRDPGPHRVNDATGDDDAVRVAPALERPRLLAGDARNRQAPREMRPAIGLKHAFARAAADAERELDRAALGAAQRHVDGRAGVEPESGLHPLREQHRFALVELELPRRAAALGFPRGFAVEAPRAREAAVESLNEPATAVVL